MGEDSDKQPPSGEQRKPYSAPELTLFGPVSLITGSNMGASAWDAMNSDFTAMLNMGMSTP